MKDEIKEIFDIWTDDDGEIVVHYIDKNNNKQEYKTITREDLLYYLTNLQEENETLKDYLKIMEKGKDNNLNRFLDYKSRCEKAIEYIKEHTNNFVEYLDVYEAKELSDILQGSDKDE